MKGDSILVSLQRTTLLFLIMVPIYLLSDRAASMGNEHTPSFDVVIGSHCFDLNALIEEEALHCLNREELSILRNAVFAKHGYKFKTAKFQEIFCSYDWYEPEHNDVSGMLSWIDLKNIDAIRKYEIGEIVHSVTKEIPDANSMIKVEFYLHGKPSRADCRFTRFKIFEVAEGSKKKVFDSNRVEDELCVYLDTMEIAVTIEDRNGDDSDELYFDLSDPISPILLIVEKVGGRYVPLYYGRTCDIFYEDIDGDGVGELLSDHPGGGGFVSWWQGLDLVNTFEDSMYIFSFQLTRRYYEQHLWEAEVAFSETQDAESFAWLLDAHADLGNYSACTTLVNQNQDLANLDREVYEKYINGPDEDLIDFTVFRAAEYERVWEELKN